MFLLNLSLAEFLMLFGALSGIVVTLYLLNRARRRQVVPTLRFWTLTAQNTTNSTRRRIQEPWSLILQILGILLLCLAIAQLRTGRPGHKPVDHVLVLDTSSWMAARSGEGTLLDEAKAAARAYVRTLPSADRVMVVHGDALATPASGFEEKREIIHAAIERARPSASALDLEQALQFAVQARSLHARRPGEIVFAGSGRSSSEVRSGLPSGFRLLPVKSGLENVGLRRVGLRRSPTDPAVWQVFLSARNFGARPQTVPLLLQFGGAPVGTRRWFLKPGATEEATFEFQTRAAGWLEARLMVNDALAEDNRVLIEIPQQQSLRVAVFSAEPDLLKPILSANSRLETTYALPAQYRPDVQADVIVLDRFRPPQPPRMPSIWLEPPGLTKPAATEVTIESWATDHPVGAGLKSRQLKLESGSVLSIRQGDTVIARMAAGPVVIARSDPAPAVLLGFHPGRQSSRFELATPLLFANIFHWIAPGAFRAPEVHALAAGSVNVPIDPASVADLRVLSDNQKKIPFTIQGSTLRFFTGEPGTVRVLARGREQVYSLTLPEVGDVIWEAPAAAAVGIPAASFVPLPSDWWRLLAALGGLVLLLEYILYGGKRQNPAGPSALKRAFLRKAS